MEEAFLLGVTGVDIYRVARDAVFLGFNIIRYTRAMCTVDLMQLKRHSRPKTGPYLCIHRQGHELGLLGGIDFFITT